MSRDTYNKQMAKNKNDKIRQFINAQLRLEVIYTIIYMCKYTVYIYYCIFGCLFLCNLAVIVLCTKFLNSSLGLSSKYVSNDDISSKDRIGSHVASEGL